MNFLVIGQTLIILSLLFAFAWWVFRVIDGAKDEKRETLFNIQCRLAAIHNELAYGDTTLFSRQVLFTELHDLLDQRRHVLLDD